MGSTWQRALIWDEGTIDYWVCFHGWLYPEVGVHAVYRPTRKVKRLWHSRLLMLCTSGWVLETMWRLPSVTVDIVIFRDSKSSMLEIPRGSANSQDTPWLCFSSSNIRDFMNKVFFGEQITRNYSDISPYTTYSSAFPWINSAPTSPGLGGWDEIWVNGNVRYW